LLYGFYSFIAVILADYFLPAIGARTGVKLAIVIFPAIAIIAYAKWHEKAAPVSEYEARTLISDLCSLLAPNPFQLFPSSSLPTHLPRMKQAFRVMVPIAVQAEDMAYLNTLRMSYVLLANFGTPLDRHIAVSIHLSAEFQGLLGRNPSLAAAADEIRLASMELEKEFTRPGTAEQVMRQIASAELVAKRMKDPPAK